MITKLIFLIAAIYLGTRYLGPRISAHLASSRLGYARWKRYNYLCRLRKTRQPRLTPFQREQRRKDTEPRAERNRHTRPRVIFPGGFVQIDNVDTSLRCYTKNGTLLSGNNRVSISTNIEDINRNG
jgi:hypothetical protein